MFLIFKLFIMSLFQTFARVSGPLFSMSASGSIAKAITYAKWKGRQYCREWFIPQNPKTALQVNVRTAMALLVAEWQGEDQGYKDTWDAFADQFNMSGFNQYVSRGMDEYVIQITTAVTPASVSVSGDPPADVWVWT